MFLHMLSALSSITGVFGQVFPPSHAARTRHMATALENTPGAMKKYCQLRIATPTEQIASAHLTLEPQNASHASLPRRRPRPSGDPPGGTRSGVRARTAPADRMRLGTAETRPCVAPYRAGTPYPRAIAVAAKTMRTTSTAWTKLIRAKRVAARVSGTLPRATATRHRIRAIIGPTSRTRIAASRPILAQKTWLWR